MAARTAVTPPATEVAPVTLVVGEEEFLVDRTVRDLIAAAREPARWSIEPAIAGTMEHRAGDTAAAPAATAPTAARPAGTTGPSGGGGGPPVGGGAAGCRGQASRSSPPACGA